LAGNGKFVEESAAPVFAVESAACQDVPGSARKRPISVLPLDDV
jgi:hypothetical protein